MVTHQGASANSGHYTAYVKKQGAVDKATGKRKEEDGKWWWFNDEKVSEVEAERIEGLSGGGESYPDPSLSDPFLPQTTENDLTNQCNQLTGESHSALILLYRAIDLPSKDEIEEKNETKTDDVIMHEGS